MNTKSKKLFAIVLTLCLLVMSSAAFAATRYAGQDRYQTAVSIVSGGWTTANTAVLATGESSADALCAAPLAKAYDAPIISVDPKGANTEALALLTKLGVKTVFIAGGTGAVPQAIEDAVKAAGMTVTRLAGASRYETSLAIANQLQTKLGAGATTIAVANGEDSSFADALSVSSIAAFKGMPILLTSASALGFTVPSSVTKSYVIGGTGVVSDAVMAQLPGAVRLSGADRYATNVAVLAAFPEFKFDKVFLATGENFPDALAGAALAANTASPVVLVSPAMPAATQTFLASKVTAATSVVALGGAAVVADSAITAVNGEVVAPGVPGGPVAVTSVTAIAANTIKVAFSAAPADTSKVAFTVANTGTAIATTVAWNDAKTEATLTTSYNLPQGTYTVAVKNDAADLGSSNVSITQQAVAKIEITSTVLSVDPTTGKGYITYKVLDQYGNDVTALPMGQNITWTPGIGAYESHKNGVIIINQGLAGSIPLTSYTSAVINGYDTDNYVTVSATLSVSQATGTISDIQLNKLYSTNNDDLNAGNSTGVWYIDFTAKDQSGNVTNNYTLVNAGIQSVNVGAFLQLVGSGNGVVQDPADTTKAAIQVQVNTTNAANLAADTQIPITVLTKSGKSGILTVTLKKAASLESFNITPPAQSVASGETVTIPYTAFDQNGKALTKYSDLTTTVAGVTTPKVNLTLSGGVGGSVSLIQNADGTASVQAIMPSVVTPTGSLTVYIQSNVILTGKSSQLTISVQQPKKPDSLAINSAVAVPFMQDDAVEHLDFGNSYGGFTLNDQYGRAMDLTNQNTTNGDYYYVVPSVTGSAITTGTINAYNDQYITLTAAAPGTATVNFEVWKHTYATGANTDMQIGKSVTYTVVNDSDITDYILDACAKQKILGSAVYASAMANDYAPEPQVWGKTSGGAKVVLAVRAISAVTIDSGDFSLSKTTQTTTFLTPAARLATDTGTTQFYVYANSFLNPTTTGSTANLTVSVIGSDSRIHNVTTALSSTTDGSTVSSVGFSASNATGAKGISIDGNTVTVDGRKTSDNGLTTYNNLNGKVLTRFDSTGSSTNRGYIYFYANDQFGTKDATVNNVSVVEQKFATSGVSVAVNQSGSDFVLNFTTPGGYTDIKNGDYYVLTATTANGQINTIRVQFVLP